jgi:hypothetical protein
MYRGCCGIHYCHSLYKKPMQIMSRVVSNKDTSLKREFDSFMSKNLDKTVLKIRLNFLKKHNLKMYNKELTAGQISRNYPELYEELKHL